MLVADPSSRGALSRLRTVCVGGEALSAPLARALTEAVPGRVLNMYGPTETTVWSTTHEVGSDDDPVPIGRPIANTRVYVLDEARQPVPRGVRGELYIGGAGVVRGYHGQPDLTGERFLADPLSPDAGGRMYRTGDLVRWRPDGRIEFLGRLDDQIKLRGHRVELGEIESALRRHDSVQDAVVVVREDVPGDQRLVAYVVAHDGPGDLDALQGHLRANLPSYMVPSAFVTIESLPVAPTGKIDRKALPPPDAKPVSRVQPPALAAGSVEETVARIWHRVLGVPHVGLDDNFFAVGGHSLLTVQVLGDIQAELGQTLPLTDLFKYPTVRSLAERLRPARPPDSSIASARERGASRRKAMDRRSAR
jgi:acyl carrier protein